jgi:RNA polymerase sigma-70 factor (ECF subfamily)
MRLLAEGRMTALRELYERHASFVYRVALRYTGAAEEARDIAQSVFVDLIEAARTFQPRAKVSTWLYRVTANRCLNWSRAAPRRKTQSLSPAIQQQAERDAATTPNKATATPEQTLIQRHQRRRVQQAIGGLPERQRIALVLRQYEGLSYARIAAALGCSEKAVASLLVRARDTLVEKLRNE